MRKEEVLSLLEENAFNEEQNVNELSTNKKSVGKLINIGRLGGIPRKSVLDLFAKRSSK